MMASPPRAPANATSGGIGRSSSIGHAPLFLIVYQRGPSRNRLKAGPNGAGKLVQNPNFAQIARVSSAEIASSGRLDSPSTASAPGERRPSRPDNMPLAGAISGVWTFSPKRARNVERRSPIASARPSDTEVSPAQYSPV